MKKLNIELTNTNLQDMVMNLVNETGLSIKESIENAINRDNYNKIIDNDYAAMAYSTWNHEDPFKEKLTTEINSIEIEITDMYHELFLKVMDIENTDINTTTAYFLLFELEGLGFNI